LKDAIVNWRYKRTKANDRQYNDTKKKDNKGQVMVDKTWHRKLQIEQHEPHEKHDADSGAPEAEGLLYVKHTSILLSCNRKDKQFLRN